MQYSFDDIQPFPESGPLHKNLNLSLSRLKKRMDEFQVPVYSYIVRTVKRTDGHFIQIGSAPNFQGGVISLCTCKHYMRTFLDWKSWPHKWIAGFSGKKEGYGENALIYLMKVDFASNSFSELWKSKKVSNLGIKAKLANKEKFGDIFQPKKNQKDEFDPLHYKPPVQSHVHNKRKGCLYAWHSDICYRGVKDRKPALLFGDPKFSFLWDHPMLFRSGELHRGQSKDDDLLSFLKHLMQKGE
jgi:hypothetical protein